MSHHRHSRNKLRRKYPLLQGPFAYANKNNVVFLCSSCSRKSTLLPEDACSAPRILCPPTTRTSKFSCSDALGA